MFNSIKRYVIDSSIFTVKVNTTAGCAYVSSFIDMFNTMNRVCIQRCRLIESILKELSSPAMASNASSALSGISIPSVVSVASYCGRQES
jgi:hypothetical protein